MNNLHTDKPTHTIVYHPFTEKTIIKLHHIFLTNGRHSITVPNIATGRIIMKKLLTSLHYYQNIAIATMAALPIETDMFDIRHHLFNSGYVPANHEYLNEFFLESCQFDFLWIETSKKLYETAWFNQFEQKIKQFNLSRQLPIVYVSYIQ
jgi:hypothetical protein